MIPPLGIITSITLGQVVGEREVVADAGTGLCARVTRVVVFNYARIE